MKPVELYLREGHHLRFLWLNELMLNKTHNQTYSPGFEVPSIFILVIQYYKFELISIVSPRYPGG
jgi:hypothetical protein